MIDYLASAPVADHRSEIPQWFALYTLPKHERAVAGRLTNVGVEVFYPSLLRESKWKDRITWIQRPLFPGYVFVRLPLDDRITVVRVAGVIRIVSCKGIPLAIPDSDIEAVRLCLVAQGHVEPHPYLECGTRARLTEGASAGLEGIISHSENGCKLVVPIAAIGQAIALELGASSFKPVTPEAAILAKVS